MSLVAGQGARVPLTVGRHLPMVESLSDATPAT